MLFAFLPAALGRVLFLALHLSPSRFPQPLSPRQEAAAFAAALQKLYTASKLESRAGFPHFQKASGSEADDEA